MSALQHLSSIFDWLRSWVDSVELFVELEEILQKHIKYYLESMTLKFTSHEFSACTVLFSGSKHVCTQAGSEQPTRSLWPNIKG